MAAGSLEQTISTVRTVWRLERLGAKGSRVGFKLRDFEFECINPNHFAFLFIEIFVAEPYRFSAASRKPYIIDGGVNIGLSIAYFKTLFPEARIAGFEPHPEAFEVARRNFERNGFRDVRLHHAALAHHPGSVPLSFIPGEIMASTIGNRLAVRGETPQIVEVPAMQLSGFLTEEVDFLKLDIEGAENEVLREAGEKLRHVRNMFVEFHLTRGDTSNSLPATLQILEQRGFDYLITSTLTSRKRHAVAPLRHSGPVSSMLIFARRID